MSEPRDYTDPGTNFGRALVIIDRLISALVPKMQTVVILIDSILFAALTYSLMMRIVPDPNRELVSAVVGFLAGNMVGPARAWLFGTTKGSEQKTQAMADTAAAGAATARIAEAVATTGTGVGTPPPGSANLNLKAGEGAEVEVTTTPAKDGEPRDPNPPAPEGTA